MYCFYGIYLKYLGILTPYHTRLKNFNKHILPPVHVHTAECVANSVHPDQTQHSITSVLGLDCLLRSVQIHRGYLW